MSLRLSEEDRHTVPTWRPARSAIRMGELDPLDKAPRVQPPGLMNSSSVADRLAEWTRNRCFATARELVGAAVVHGQHTEAVPAAQFLLARADALPPRLRRQAEGILGEGPSSPESARGPSGQVAAAEDVDPVARLRARLRSDPRNALAWADLARHHASHGKKERAERAIRAGLSQAPDNRFLLRSAARFFLHIKQPDRAHSLLLRASVTRYDPWLLAAEIALAARAGRKSKLIRTARELVAGGHIAPRHLAELNSALGTEYLASGDRKEARRAFYRSLEAPTDNALAQAVWAAKRHEALELQPDLLASVSYAEARALESYWEFEWADAVAWCVDWFAEERFARRPAIWGSYLAAVALQDPQRCRYIAVEGLKANPEDPLLLNNLTVALADLDRLPEAIKTFRSISLAKAESGFEIAHLATAGLLAFRQGDPGLGRVLYDRAITRASGAAHKKQRTLAELHLAREELLCGSGSPDVLLNRVRVESARLKDPDIRVMLTAVEALQAGQAASDTPGWTLVRERSGPVGR